MDSRIAKKTCAGQAMIPWQNKQQWVELQFAIEQMCRRLGDERSVIMELVESIKATFLAVDNQLQTLCEKTCISCRDVCCMRATVWYETKDLLYMQLAGYSLQENQVRRENDGTCCFLGENGCSLPRDERPFICTWYICADQKAMLNDQGEAGRLLVSRIEHIKQSRKLLEEKCFQAVMM